MPDPVRIRKEVTPAVVYRNGREQTVKQVASERYIFKTLTLQIAGELIFLVRLFNTLYNGFVDYNTQGLLKGERFV